MRFCTLKNILPLTCALLLTVQSGIPVASASGIPTVDFAHIIETTLGVGQNTITAAESTITAVQKMYEWSQTFILQALKVQMVSKLQDMVIGYAQGGGGAPKFVTDWKSYLGSSRTDAAKNFSKSLSASKDSICAPFRKELLETMGTSPNEQGSGEAIDDLACDPSDPSKSQNNYAGALLIARLKQQGAITEAEKAAQYEATAGQGFLSGKKKDGTITTPGSLIKDLTANASKADFDLITNAKQLTDLASVVSSFTSKLSQGDDTNGNDSGLAGISLRERVRRRNDADAAHRNTSDGTHMALTQLEIIQECDNLFPPVYLNGTNDLDPDLDETALRNNCLEGLGAETGNGQGLKAQLLKNIGDMIQTRQAAKIAFTETLATIRKQLSAFDANANDILDDNSTCSVNLPGRKKRTGETAGTPYDTDGHVPSSITTGKIFRKASGTSIPCAVATSADKQNAGQLAVAFDELLLSRDELKSLREQNITALDALIDFRKRVRAAKEKDDTYTDNGKNDTLPELTDELRTGNDMTTRDDPAGYVCGEQILLHPEFNQECTDYTIGRAKFEIDQQSDQGEISAEETQECDPATDSTCE